MPRYKCLNKECTWYNIVKVENSVTRIVKGEVVDSATQCPFCGRSRILIIEDGMTTQMSGGDNVCKR